MTILTGEVPKQEPKRDCQGRGESEGKRKLLKSRVIDNNGDSSRTLPLNANTERHMVIRIRKKGPDNPVVCNLLTTSLITVGRITHSIHGTRFSSLLPVDIPHNSAD
jgi:hypothetical protein